MANTTSGRSSSGRKTSGSGRSSSSAAGRKTTTAKRTSSNTKRSTSSSRNVRNKKNNEGFSRDLGVILLFAGMIFLFLSNFGIMGKAGDFFSGILFGLFGWSAYFIPVFAFAFIMFLMFGRPGLYVRQIIAVFILPLLFGVTMSLLHDGFSHDYIYRASDLYRDCAREHSGGGVLFGSTAWLLYRLFRMAGTVLFMIVLLIIAFLLFTGSSLTEIMNGTSSKVEEYRPAAAERRAER
ncbi:MAG: DNA translocase FtsK 4TM domain-containing protein, partial [Lachnospiraceae bacterium]|nr:DNA translocase FtsK 4TM domain-containing protein [Lachnospiraceae bacterium]